MFNGHHTTVTSAVVTINIYQKESALKAMNTLTKSKTAKMSFFLGHTTWFRLYNQHSNKVSKLSEGDQ